MIDVLDLVRMRFWVLLAVLLSLSACGNDPKDLVESADRREASGDRVGAMIDLKAALAAEPNNGAIRFKLGRLHNEAFDFLSAEKELRRAVELGVVESGRVAVQLGNALRGQGQYKKILAEIEVSPAYEPKQNALIHVLRGRSHLQLGDISKAKAALSEARALAPDLAEVRLFEAQIRVAQSDERGAEVVVDSVLKEHPRNFEGLAYKGRMLLDQGKREEALEIYGRMLEIHPTHFQALVNRSMTYISLGKLPEARKDLDSLARTYKGNARVQVQLGVWHLASGNNREALEAAQMALRDNSAPPEAYLLAGLAYLRSQSPLQASNALQIYVSRVPGSTNGRKFLAEALIRQNQGKKALEVLAPALESDTNDWTIYALAGETSAHLGDFAQATRWYAKAADIAPTNTDLLARKALMQAGEGKVDDALNELSGVLESAKVATKADELLILGYLGRKRFDDAEAALRAFERRAPNSAVVENLRGIVLLANGDKAGAEQAFEAALKLNPAFFAAAKNRAMLDLRDGKVDLARKRLEGVVSADKSKVTALLALAELEEAAGRVTASIEWLRRAVEAQPGSLGPRLRLANTYLKVGEFRKANETAEELLARFGDNGLALHVAAEVQLRSGNVSRAIQSLNHLVQVAPTGASYFRLARAQLAAKQVNEGEASLRKALQVQPDYVPAQVGLGALLTQRSRTDEAIAFARSLQTTQPKSAVGFVIEGEVYEATGKLKEALAAYQNAFKRQESGAVAVSVFRVRAKAGEPAEALIELEKWLTANPGEVFARHLAAAAHAKSGDYKKAAEHYRFLVQLNRRDAEALNGLAWSLYKLNDPSALEVAEAAFRANPRSPSVLDTLGWLLVEKGDLQRGAQLLSQAKAMVPNNKDVWFHFAVAAHKQGKKAVARQELQALLAAAGDFSYAAEARALLDSLR